jgi:isopentenyl-diphosphate delta-isomerase type 1
MLEIFDDGGQMLGLRSRERVHSSGAWHRAVNVVLFRSDGKLLLQRRSARKDVYPGAWDLSVAEHLETGESYLEAAYRGLREELSIDAVLLEPFGGMFQQELVNSRKNVRDREFQMYFIGMCDQAPAKCAAEVAETRHVSWEQVAAMRVKSPSEFTPWFRFWLDAAARRGWSVGAAVSSSERPAGHPSPGRNDGCEDGALPR